MIKKSSYISLLKYIYLILFIVLIIFIYKVVDINFIGEIFNNSELNTGSANFYSLIVLLILRSISILIPILPGTYCSVIAGYLFGIRYGLLIVFIADFFSCSLSFFMSRKFGRNFVSKFLGKRQMKRVENISQKYLENNLFLMTGFLLTSWFDFVCYAIGLTKISWKKFMPALIISIIISDIPFVSAGYTLRGLSDINLQKILNGEVSMISGGYLLFFIISVLLIFGLGLINITVKKNIN